MPSGLAPLYSVSGSSSRGGGSGGGSSGSGGRIDSSPSSRRRCCRAALAAFSARRVGPLDHQPRSFTRSSPGMGGGSLGVVEGSVALDVFTVRSPVQSRQRLPPPTLSPRVPPSCPELNVLSCSACRDSTGSLDKSRVPGQ